MALPKNRSPFAPRIEQKGRSGDYLVSGWRYADLAIWHVNVSPSSDQSPEQIYMVAAGEFYPELLSSEAKHAVLRLIAVWEQSGVLGTQS
jgi:hypothetical protein